MEIGHTPIGNPIKTPEVARKAISDIWWFCRDNLEDCRIRSVYGGEGSWTRLSKEELAIIAEKFEVAAAQIRESLNLSGCI